MARSSKLPIQQVARPSDSALSIMCPAAMAQLWVAYIFPLVEKRLVTLSWSLHMTIRMGACAIQIWLRQMFAISFFNASLSTITKNQFCRFPADGA